MKITAVLSGDKVIIRMIWRVILFWWLSVNFALCDLPHLACSLPARHSCTKSLPANLNFQYDANGNLTYSGNAPLYYDAENRLTNMMNTGPVAFVYDGLNRLRIERYYTYQGGQWVQTNETRLIYDGMQVIQERDTNSNPLVTYTRGLDLSMSLGRAGGIGGMLARTDTNGSTFYHSDGSGNITALMDGNENIVARYEYDAYGRLIGKWGSYADINRYRFSSKECGSQAGIYYYGRRFYDPNFQRWLNRDPIGESGGINSTYGFAANSPLNAIDAYGLAYHYYNRPSLLGVPMPTDAANYVYGDTLLEQTVSSVNNVGYFLANTAVGIGQFLHWGAAKAVGEQSANGLLLAVGLPEADFGFIREVRVWNDEGQRV